MAQNLRAAIAEREDFVRPFMDRYDRAEREARASPIRVRAAEQFVRAAHRADQVFGERIEEGLAQYRRLMKSQVETRF